MKKISGGKIEMKQASAQSKGPDTAYKTEDQLKAEAKARAEQQAKLEAARKPRSATEKKVENYWYHYKWATIGGIVGVVLLAFFVKDLIFKVNPDITINFYSSQYYSTETIGELEEALTGYVQDINGDGKLVVQIDYLQLPSTIPGQEDEEATADSQGDLDDMVAGAADAQLEYASSMKLMAVLAANSDPIFLLDEHGYQYITRSDDEDAASVFQSIEGIGDADDSYLPVEDTKLMEHSFSQDLEGLRFYCRSGKEEGRGADYRAACLEFLQGLVS